MADNEELKKSEEEIIRAQEELVSSIRDLTESQRAVLELNNDVQSELSSVVQMMGDQRSSILGDIAAMSVRKKQTESQIQTINENIKAGNQLLASQKNIQSAIESHISSLNDSISQSEATIDHNKSQMAVIEEELNTKRMSVEKQVQYRKILERSSDTIKNQTDLQLELSESIKDAVGQYDMISSEIEKTERSLKGSEVEMNKVANSAAGERFNNVSRVLKKVSSTLMEFIKTLRETQQVFGVSVGEAFSLRVEAFAASVTWMLLPEGENDCRIYESFWFE